jgi:hypothetical protein
LVESWTRRVRGKVPVDPFFKPGTPVRNPDRDIVNPLGSGVDFDHL